MENSLQMRTEATYSLNFLVYIQNIFLNQTQSKEEFKFPYIPIKYIFQEDFEFCFKHLWDEVSHRISEHPMNDIKIFNEEKGLFYQRLFNESDDNLTGYTEIYQSYKIWWDSFAGRFSVERSIDVVAQKLYMELANSLIQNEIEPQKDLNISLIYDECLLVNLDASSYFAVLSTKDFFVKYKETVLKLLRIY
jgi:predicted DNA binding CopG/RHH family protein